MELARQKKASFYKVKTVFNNLSTDASACLFLIVDIVTFYEKNYRQEFKKEHEIEHL